MPLKEPVCIHIREVTDRVCIDGNCSPSQSFYIADNYVDELTSQPVDGILGLPAEQPGTFYWNLVNSGQLPSPEFSWYIEPHSSHGSEMTLGGIDKGKFRGSITTIPLSSIAAYFKTWLMDIPAVYVEGHRIVNTTAPGQPPLHLASANLDGGTAFMQTPDHETAQLLYALISPEIYPIDAAIGTWGAACDVVDRVKKDVTFTFGTDGKQQMNVTMPKDSFNAGPYPGNPSLCQTIFNSGHGGR